MEINIVDCLQHCQMSNTPYNITLFFIFLLPLIHKIKTRNLSGPRNVGLHFGFEMTSSILNSSTDLNVWGRWVVLG